jgi:hypothetical protein
MAEIVAYSFSRDHLDRSYVGSYIRGLHLLSSRGRTTVGGGGPQNKNAFFIHDGTEIYRLSKNKLHTYSITAAVLVI